MEVYWVNSRVNEPKELEMDKNKLALMAGNAVISVLVGCSICAFSGCFGTSVINDTASVSGKVLLDGKPAHGANVEFQSGQNIQSTFVDEQGTYQMVNLKPGNYTIAIKSPQIGQMRSRKGGDISSSSSSKPISIPQKYQEGGSSGFKVVVTAGEVKTLDVEMKVK